MSFQTQKYADNSAFRHMFNQLHNNRRSSFRQRGDRILQGTWMGLCIWAGVLFGLVGCQDSSQSPQVEQKDTPSAQSSPSEFASRAPTALENSEKPDEDDIQLPVASSPIYSPTVSPTRATNSLITVTIYKADRDCVRFLPQSVQVERDRPIAGAVAQVLQEFSYPNFQLSGYQIQLDRSGTATIDLQPTATSRTLAALSACEQLALFGSLRETLTQNTDWQIKTLRFTQDGKELSL
jgi:hypothetical protein